MKHTLDGHTFSEWLDIRDVGLACMRMPSYDSTDSIGRAVRQDLEKANDRLDRMVSGEHDHDDTAGSPPEQGSGA